jgi:hypothetical protein
MHANLLYGSTKGLNQPDLLLYQHIMYDTTLDAPTHYDGISEELGEF